MSGRRHHRRSWVARGVTLAAIAVSTGGALGAVPLVAYPPAVTGFVGRTLSVAPGLVTSGIVTASIAPALPPGLVFDGATGAIGGTPTTLQAPTAYTVTIVDDGGATTVPFSLAVATMPSRLSYRGPATVHVGGVLSLTAGGESTGRAIFRVVPALPVGITLGRTTGAIFGSPRRTTPRNTYRVTMTDANGATSALLVLTVLPAVPIVTANILVTPMPRPAPRPAIHLPVFPSAASGNVLSARLTRPLLLRDQAAVDSTSSYGPRLQPKSTPVVRVVAATQRGTFVWLRIQVPGKTRTFGWVDRRGVKLAPLSLARWDAILASAQSRN